ncbi:GIDE domain-containing protein [Thioalkalivibrio sp.]|uniref:GIDE domain-containing protein n=1 Tax=Thioalkalivibrio sp. TaxID=2093813 RepID=UPI0035662C6A
MLAGWEGWLRAADAADFAFAAGALLLLAGGGLYGFLRYSQLLRLVGGIPTARIRSAPQGLVQLEGAADWLPGPEIVAPLSGLPCVWYRYRIEEKRGSGGRKRRRVIVAQGQSDDLFLLRDETGDCVVDPDGAMVIRPERDVWYSPSRALATGPRGGSRWGGRYRHTEERLHAHQPLLALGEFATRRHEGADRHERLRDLLGRWKNDPEIIQRFDSSGDGRLSLPDWERVRAAARTEVEREMSREPTPDAVHLLHRGGPGTQRLLLLSTLGESQILFRQRLRAYGSALVFIVTASLLFWALAVRF